MDETPQQCLKHEIMEELEVDIEVGSYLGESIIYSNGKIKLITYFKTIIDGETKLLVHDKIE